MTKSDSTISQYSPQLVDPVDSRNRLLALEKPVALEVNGVTLATLMCTPFDLDLLALGYLFSGGYIAGIDEVVGLSVCPDNSRVKVKSTKEIASAGQNVVIASACGASPTSVFRLDGAPKLAMKRGFSLADIRAWAKSMFEQANLYRATGGMHCAALVLDDGSLRIFEDVGRHNAVDKAIGQGFFEKADFSLACLISSGRVAADMVAKAVTVGVPLIVSQSIPTTAAYEIAVEKGLTLIGRVHSASPIVYSAPERIVP